MGTSAPERNNRGKIRNWTISEKPSLSENWEASAIPKPTNVIAINTRKSAASGRDQSPASSKPSGIEIRRISVAWTIAVVDPPAIRPSTIDVRLTGATRISFRKPTSWSERIASPAKEAPNSIEKPTMPGTRYWRYATPSGSPGMGTPRSPKPRNTRNNSGNASEPAIWEGVRTNRFTSRSQSP
jgi:hypothetical protein